MKPFLIILFSVFSLAVRAQDKPESPQEKKAVALVARLPEVVGFNRHMIKTYGKPLLILIDDEPAAADPVYTVDVIEDMTDHEFTYWRFCVNAETKAMSYFDVIANKKIPLDIWRKNGRKP